MNLKGCWDDQHIITDNHISLLFHNDKEEFRMKYVLQKSEGSHCSHCNGTVYLLIEELGNFESVPTFYICFECKRAFHAGVGEVRKI